MSRDVEDEVLGGRGERPERTCTGVRRREFEERHVMGMFGERFRSSAARGRKGNSSAEHRNYCREARTPHQTSDYLEPLSMGPPAERDGRARCDRPICGATV